MATSPGRQIVEFGLISAAGTLAFWLFQPFSVTGLIIGLGFGAISTFGRRKRRVLTSKKLPKLTARKVPKIR